MSPAVTPPSSDPIQDPQRLDALRATGLLDSPSEPDFDRYTALASRILGTPASLVTFLAEDRQFFKSSRGLPAEWEAARETPIAHSFCRHVVESREPLVVEDARSDPRVRDNPGIESLQIIAYAGFPLVMEGGEVLGSFSVIDREPRTWSKDDLATLEGLTRSVITEIRLRTELVRSREKEQALAESHTRLQQIANHISEAIWIYTADFKEALYISPRAAELWGVPLDELYESPLGVLSQIDPEDRPRVRAAMASGVRSEVEFRITRRSDGVRRWMRIVGAPIHDEEGRYHRAAGIAEDVTERRSTEEALRQREAHYRRLVEASPYAIYAVDTEGRIMEVNPAGERLVGKPAGQVMGTSFESFFSPEDLPPARRHFRELVTGARPVHETDLVIQHASGESRRIRVVSTAIRKDGSVTGIHGLARDVTREIAQEEQFRRSQRLASLGTLVGGVAHELNNPLAAIQGLVQILQESDYDEETVGILRTIRRETERTAGIVGNLRRLVRGSRQDVRHREEVELNEVVRHVIRTRRYSMATRDIEVKADLASDLPPVAGDPSQLEQVVLNLVVNAEQALDQVDGNRRLILRTRSARDGITLSVYDTGPGIQAQDLPRIFDPFWTTKEPNEGMGLGLSLVHQIVTEHRGEVDVQSRVGEGTLFLVTLPPFVSRKNEEDPADPSSPGPAALDLEPCRILVVDDEPAIRQVLDRALTRAGHRVWLAGDGFEALALAEDPPDDESFDLVFSDLRMPGMDGGRLLKALEELDPGYRGRTIFITGDLATPEAEIAADRPDIPVIQKPFDLAELTRFIQEIQGV